MTELLQNWSAEKVIRVIQQVEEGLNSNEASEQLSATKKVRQLLSIDRDPSGSQFHDFNDGLDREIVPQLLKFLKRGDDPQLQMKALWALCNAAAGSNEYTSMLLQNGAVPTLVKLLQSTNNEVLEQAVWVLGNIATDGSAARDAVLHAGAMVPLIRILLAGCTASKTKVSLMRIAAWTLSSLCDGQPHYSSFDVHKVLTAVSQVLVSSTDTEVLSLMLGAEPPCDGPSPHVQAVVEKDVCGRLVALLGHRSWRVVKPALRTVGNIVCAEDDMDYTQHVVDRNTVPCLRKLINHSNREIQKEACWTLSNIAAGTQPQIQCVLESGAVEPLVKSPARPRAIAMKIEACWVLLNATSCGSNSQIQYLVEKGCVQVLCDLLGETTMVMMALEGIEKILQVGEDIAKKSKERLRTICGHR